MNELRQHLCPVCQKRWPCLAETPPRDKHYHLKRPLWECAYPDALPCVRCAQEGRTAERRAV